MIDVVKIILIGGGVVIVLLFVSQIMNKAFGTKRGNAQQQAGEAKAVFKEKASEHIEAAQALENTTPDNESDKEVAGRANSWIKRFKKH